MNRFTSQAIHRPAGFTLVELPVVSERKRCAFTLVELLVVIGIMAILMGILAPALSKARDSAKNVVCGSALHQLGISLGSYVADFNQRLPYIDSALMSSGSALGHVYDWNADPTDESNYPHEMPAVLGKYMVCNGLMRCPSAVLGYPENNVMISYRMSSADNYDGKPRTVEDLRTYLTGSKKGMQRPGGLVDYSWDLKYLNGRPYDLRVKRTDLDAMVAEGFNLGDGYPLTRGPGEFYLFRDFVNRKGDQWLTPHSVAFNQLYLDLHIEFIKQSEDRGLTDDRPGD